MNVDQTKHTGRRWENYIHKNKTEGDCQLVTAVNAYHYLTGKVVNKKFYDKLINLCGCIHGSCIDINKAFVQLGICEKKRLIILGSELDLVSELPLEINIWHKFFGFHSILAIDWSTKLEAYRVTNFRHVASSLGWIFEEDLMQFIILNPNKDEPRWKGRTFKIIDSKK